MAGHIIYNYLSSMQNYKIRGVDESDIFNNDLIVENKSFYKEDEPDYVINCIRCLVNESKLNPNKAIIYNSYFPHLLEKLYRETKTKIIFLSTDCVFSGKKGNYSENSTPDASSLYAKTKALGEIANKKDITIRTSFIGPNIGRSSEELFHWFMKQNGTINGYNKVYWTGVSTLELAKVIDKIVKKNIFGIYHLVPDTKISKYELLIILKKIWKKNVIINQDNTNICDKSLVDNRGEIIVNSYKIMFNELYTYMLNNKDIYKQYFNYNL